MSTLIAERMNRLVRPDIRGPSIPTIVDDKVDGVTVSINLGMHLPAGFGE